MTLDASLLAVIEAAYGTIGAPEQWPVVLKQLAAATDCQAAVLWAMDHGGHLQFPAFTVHNFDPGGVDEYVNQYVSICPNIAYLLAHPEQRIVHDGLYLDERDIDRHVYYDWQGRWTDMRYRIIGQMQSNPNVQAGISLHRTRKSGRFQTADIAAFTELYAHLERALSIGFQLGHLGAFQQWSEDLLDQSPLGIVLLDQHNRILFANRRARALDEQNDGVHLSRAGLQLATLDDQKALDRLLAQAKGQSEHGAQLAGTLRITRRSGRHPYFLSVSPTPRSSQIGVVHQPTLTVTLNDPEHHSPPAEEHLRALFGLTPAEAKLASLLADGLELRDAADRLHIQYSSARVRLATIFQKTHTKRQSELLRLIHQVTARV